MWLLAVSPVWAETVEWVRTPIPVTLGVGVERQVRFEGPAHGGRARRASGDRRPSRGSSPTTPPTGSRPSRSRRAGSGCAWSAPASSCCSTSPRWRTRAARRSRSRCASLGRRRTPSRRSHVPAEDPRDGGGGAHPRRRPARPRPAPAWRSAGGDGRGRDRARRRRRRSTATRTGRGCAGPWSGSLRARGSSSPPSRRRTARPSRWRSTCAGSARRVRPAAARPGGSSPSAGPVRRSPRPGRQGSPRASGVVSREPFDRVTEAAR